MRKGSPFLVPFKQFFKTFWKLRFEADVAQQEAPPTRSSFLIQLTGQGTVHYACVLGRGRTV